MGRGRELRQTHATRRAFDATRRNRAAVEASTPQHGHSASVSPLPRHCVMAVGSNVFPHTMHPQSPCVLE